MTPQHCPAITSMPQGSGGINTYVCIYTVVGLRRICLKICLEILWWILQEMNSYFVIISLCKDILFGRDRKSCQASFREISRKIARRINRLTYIELDILTKQVPLCTSIHSRKGLRWFLLSMSIILSSTIYGYILWEVQYGESNKVYCPGSDGDSRSLHVTA